MALGGGTFITENKVLPGAYMNFVSVSKASATVSDRGVAAIALPLDWGAAGEVFSVEAQDILDNSTEIFGYAYTSDKMKGIRDLAVRSTTIKFYRLNGAGTKASNKYGTALYAGPVGNRITVVVDTNITDTSKFDVLTYLDSTLMDEQDSVSTTDDLTANKFVSWKSGVTLEADAGTLMTGGANKDGVTGSDHQAALTAFEGVSFNTLGCLSDDSVTKALYTQYCKRQRDEVGKKFQVVVYNATKPDYEGVINLLTPADTSGSTSTAGKNTYTLTANAVATDTFSVAGVTLTAGTDFNVGEQLSDTASAIAASLNANESFALDYAATAVSAVITVTEKEPGTGHTPGAATVTGTLAVTSGEGTTSISGLTIHNYDLVYWTTGAEAGCAINADLTNTTYDGEYTPVAGYSQAELIAAIKAGHLVFHKVDEEYRVLDDINSFVSVTDEKNDIFQSNQVIRVIDNIANDVAVIFDDQYLGKVQNDKTGRASFWNQVCNYLEQLESIRAIQNFDTDNVTVAESSSSQNAVDLTIAALDIVGVMKQLYMTTHIE